jgi:hypothetical protein
LKFKVSKLSSKIKVSPAETETIIADVVIAFDSIIYLLNNIINLGI